MKTFLIQIFPPIFWFTCRNLRCYRAQEASGYLIESELAANGMALSFHCPPVSTDPAVYGGPIPNYTDYCYVGYSLFWTHLI